MPLAIRVQVWSLPFLFWFQKSGFKPMGMRGRQLTGSITPSASSSLGQGLGRICGNLTIKAKRYKICTFQSISLFHILEDKSYTYLFSFSWNISTVFTVNTNIFFLFRIFTLEPKFIGVCRQWWHLLIEIQLYRNKEL